MSGGFYFSDRMEEQIRKQRKSWFDIIRLTIKAVGVCCHCDLNPFWLCVSTRLWRELTVGSRCLRWSPQWLHPSPPPPPTSPVFPTSSGTNRNIFQHYTLEKRKKKKINWTATSRFQPPISPASLLSPPEKAGPHSSHPSASSSSWPCTASSSTSPSCCSTR